MLGWERTNIMNNQSIPHYCSVCGEPDGYHAHEKPDSKCSKKEAVELKHEVDTEIPPETSQFDEIAEKQGQPEDPMMAEAVKSLQLQIARARQLAQAFLNHKGQAANMLGENYVNADVARAEFVVISKIFEERLGIKPADYVKAVAEELDKILMIKQMEYKIIITPDGVTNG